MIRLFLLILIGVMTGFFDINDLSAAIAPSKKSLNSNKQGPHEKATQKTVKKTTKAAQKALGQYTAYIATGKNQALDHIMERHWFNANSGAKASHFNQSMTINKLNDIATIALNKGNKSTGGNGRIIYEYRFKKPIGKAINGKSAYVLRVVTEPSQSIGNKLHVVTAFPI